MLMEIVFLFQKSLIVKVNQTIPAQNVSQDMHYKTVNANITFQTVLKWLIKNV